ncbi:MAG: TIGR03118 family protein [Acidobacteria bacterium]|nr:TIGR03118 family protein [Acidobacteriota bacterium]
MFRSPARKRRLRRSLSLALTLIFMVAFIPPPPAARYFAGAARAQEPNVPSIAPGSAYRQTNLISDVPGLSPVLDPLLVNPWGLTVRGTSPFWAVNNGTSTTQLIRGDVSGAPVVLNPNPQTINIPGGLPTGTVGNSTTDFQITPPGGGTPAAANFIFDSITGNITAWNGASGAAAQNVVSMPGHVWTGLAIGSNSGGNRLYAADFANNHIDVFTGTFTATTVTGGFIDATIPAGFAPFNIQNLGGSLYVAYAKVGTGGHDQAGVGNGYVRKFNTDGVRDLTFAINNGALNSPWGLTIAPASFGVYGNALLVGNFGEGNGSIHAYNPTTGAPSATDNALKDESNHDIVIDELWALAFGNGGNGGDVNTLYFTSGLGEEEHGLFGKLNPTTSQATSLIQFATDNFAVDEAGGHVDFTVIRTGDTSGAATVNYNTFDESSAGHASQKSDYEISLGTLSFAAGETSKTFRILIVDDKFVEGDETIDLMLSNPTGTGVGLGNPNKAEVTILDNDSTPPATNPIDDPSFFVRQHYLDFLNREPDAAGQAFWTNEITSCAGNAACIENKRVNVSAAFFLSIEFQRTGYLAYLTHRTAFGANASGSPAPVLYGNFMRDVQTLQRGFVFGAPGADAVLEANKVAYFNEFVTRPEFVAKYPSTLTNDQYVDNLLASAGLSPSQVRLFVVSLTNSQEVPPTVPTTTTGAARPASSGTARFQFNDAQTAMTFTATISNIDVGGQTADTNDDLVAAHIHAGASVAPGVNGPVVWGFFGAPFNDNNPNDQSFFPTPGGVGGTFSGKWDAPEGNGTTLAAQLDNLRNGRAYINFHTKQFGGGEIRGNFPAADAFRNSLVAGLNGSTMTRAQVLRAIAESEELNSREFNSAFVTMEYFGYLRRDPDTAGFNFWLNKLNAFNGNFQNAEMVKAFISSSEYRQRFGPS